MKRILLTGMSGTGKSTIIKELKSLGYRTIDMDYDDWSEYRPDGEWVWREDRISDLLNQETNETIFIAGCAINQGKFYPQFDEIILLSTPKEILVERLQYRATNPYGKKENELKKILSDLENIEPLLRKNSTYEIVTDIPVEKVVKKLLDAVKLKN